MTRRLRSRGKPRLFIIHATRGHTSLQLQDDATLNWFQYAPDKGGWGSLGANVRFDYLDLSDGLIVGDKQNAYQASLNWKPMDYILFGLNYAHIVYRDAAIVVDGDRDYSVDVVGLRSQVDF